LNLNGNQINTVPTEIVSLEKLELLDLSFNEIKDFSVDIKKLKNLKTLVLKDNPDLKLSDELIEYCQNNQIELLY
jgi:Leucine-rich repeat (LRR) protein